MGIEDNKERGSEEDEDLAMDTDKRIQDHWRGEIRGGMGAEPGKKLEVIPGKGGRECIEGMETGERVSNAGSNHCTNLSAM